MGDNRSHSRDSRAHVNEPGGGFVPVKNVVGRAFAEAWPVPRWSTLAVPGTFHQAQLNAPPATPPQPSAPAALGVVGVIPLAMRRSRLTTGGTRDTSAPHGA